MGMHTKCPECPKMFRTCNPALEAEYCDNLMKCANCRFQEHCTHSKGSIYFCSTWCATK